MELKNSVFWGLTVNPNKRYETEVDEPFRITKACLKPSTATEGRTSSLVFEDSEKTEFIIANLSLSNFNETLDLAFNRGEKICLKVNGSATVHLTGHLLEPDNDVEDSESDESDSDESEEEVLEEKVLKRKLVEETGSAKKRKKLQDEIVESKNVLKTQAPNIASKKDDKNIKLDISKTKPVPQVNGKLDNGNNKKPVVKENTKAKSNKTTESQIKGGKENVSMKSKESSNKNRTSTGLIIKDVVIGKGQEAKKGNGVGMYYKGRLESNDKLFDACVTGKPFKFKLGAKQVIAGWDQGIAGMKVGGKRRFIVPPHLAYGSSGAPPAIPSNATLVFDVECKFVKVYGGNNVL